MQVRYSKDRSGRLLSNHSFAERNLFAYLYESLNVYFIAREHPNNVHNIHYHMAFVTCEYLTRVPQGRRHLSTDHALQADKLHRYLHNIQPGFLPFGHRG